MTPQLHQDAPLSTPGTTTIEDHAWRVYKALASVLSEFERNIPHNSRLREVHTEYSDALQTTYNRIVRAEREAQDIKIERNLRAALDMAQQQIAKLEQHSSEPLPIDYDMLSIGAEVIVPIDGIYRYGLVQDYDEDFDPVFADPSTGVIVNVRWYDPVARKRRTDDFALLDVCYYDSRNQ